ncbi:MAG: AAA family ATPase [Lentisphaeria bacterium]|nr:AAA family ATPase [Lentisphaeria bacterium]
MPKLIIQEGYKLSGEFTVPPGESFIGRNPDVALRLDHNGISRVHCRIQNVDGVVTLEDMNSRNGTFVNAQPISTPVQLKHLDHIQLDEVLLVFSASDLKAAENTELDLSQDQRSSKLAFVNDVVMAIKTNMAQVIQGKDDVIMKVLIALISDGHVLLEDVPGVGKTKLAQALAKSIRTDFKRIQFTPDMLPNDVTGVSVYDESARRFVFMPGPIFSNVVLADEINRGTPRVQSSLLECMAESMVTVDGSAHILRKPFFVIATQNPVDFHGTYPLPEAQLDRFIMRLQMGYPETGIEKDILASQAEINPLNTISHVAEGSDILHCQALIRSVFVSEPVRDYIVTIVDETRKHPAFSYGCSPRASLALMRASQTLAAINGRDHVLPRDVRELAAAVLAHRLPLKLQARAEWPSATHVLEAILENLPLARWENARGLQHDVDA